MAQQYDIQDVEGRTEFHPVKPLGMMLFAPLIAGGAFLVGAAFFLLRPWPVDESMAWPFLGAASCCFLSAFGMLGLFAWGWRRREAPLVVEANRDLRFNGILWAAEGTVRSVRWWIVETENEDGPPTLSTEIRLELDDERFPKLPWPHFVQFTPERGPVFAAELAKALQVPVENRAVPPLTGRTGAGCLTAFLLLIGVPHLLGGLLAFSQGIWLGLVFVASGSLLCGISAWRLGAFSR